MKRLVAHFINAVKLFPLPSIRIRAVSFSLAILVVLATTGCISHPVAFDSPIYHVPRSDASRGGVAIVAVIDPSTLGQTYAVHSWLTGIANSWNAEPGRMLEDVVKIELPQAFGRLNLAPAYAEPEKGDHKLIVVFTIPRYDFAKFHASLDVHAVVYRPGHVQVLGKTYHAEGFTQGAKMFWGGAFAMKSAIRQSSLDAFKKIFAELRHDLEGVLATET